MQFSIHVNFFWLVTSTVRWDPAWNFPGAGVVWILTVDKVFHPVTYGGPDSPSGSIVDKPPNCSLPIFPC